MYKKEGVIISDHVQDLVQ